MGFDLYSDREIAAGCANNDRRYQEMLYRRYSPKMYGICLGYAGQRALAQDILQDAFVKVFRNIRQYNGEGSLESWIRKIVTNTAIDSLRKRARTEPYLSESVPEVHSGAVDPGIKTLEAKDILTQIARLPEGARMVFNLYALEGYSH